MSNNGEYIPIDSPHPSLKVDKKIYDSNDPNSTVNKPVILYKGPLIVKWIKDKLKKSEPVDYSNEFIDQLENGLESYGEIAFFLSPNPHIGWRHYRSHSGLFLNTRPVFELPKNKFSYIATRIAQEPARDWSQGNLISKTTPTTRNRLVSSIEIGKPTDILDEIRFYLINFQIFYLPNTVCRQGEIDQKAGLRLQSNGWVFDIERRPDFALSLNYLEEHQGYAITHNCRIRRVNRKGKYKTFTFKEVELALDAIQIFASFIRGGMVGVALPVGYLKGESVYEKWYGTPVDPGRYPELDRPHPFPGWYLWHMDNSVDSLSPLFSHFAAKWWHSDPQLYKGFWRDVLRELVHTYTDAERINPSRGIVSAVIALETLGWAVLVIMEKWLTVSRKGVRGGYDVLSTADRIRLLLNWAGLSTNIPSTLPNLTKKARTNGWDGPQSIIWVRNRVVHPDKREQINSGIAIESWSLAMWYTEMIILKALKYNGDYRDRLFNGEIKRVPWVDITSSDNSGK